MRHIGSLIYAALLLVATMAAVSAQGRVALVPVTLAQYVGTLDWSSLAVAALLALTGGAGRTAVSLFREGQTIESALRETIKDALLALFTGALCFVVLAAYSAALAAPPLPIQAGFIFVAGFARGKFIDWLDSAFGKALDLGFDLATNLVRSRLPQPPPDGKS